MNREVILRWRFDDLNNNFSMYNVYKSTSDFSSIGGLYACASIADVNRITFTDSDVQLGVQYFYTVTTVDANGYENDHIYVLGPVVDFGISVATVALDTGRVGYEYSDTLRVNGGEPPYTWEITQGYLPSGLRLDETTGIISGTSMTEGTYTITVKVSDAQSQPYFADKQLSLVVFTPSSVDDDVAIPNRTMLHQNYPNPFNGQTTIRYQLKHAGRVTITVYNTLGQQVKTLLDQNRAAGYYSVSWDGKDEQDKWLMSGIYIYRMTIQDYTERKKLLYMR